MSPPIPESNIFLTIYPSISPHTVTASFCEHKQASAKREWGKQEQGCVQHSAQLCLWVCRERMQQQPVTPSPHSPSIGPHPPFCPVFPLTCPLLSTSHLPLYLSCLFFVTVPQSSPGAVIPSAAVQDVRETGKKPQVHLCGCLSFFLCTTQATVFNLLVPVVIKAVPNDSVQWCVEWSVWEFSGTNVGV